jgi:transposase-like protein
VSRTSSAFTSKPYGVARVCRIWDVARSTVYWRRQPSLPEPQRRGPCGFHTDAELANEIKSALTESPFTGEGYRMELTRFRGQLIL